MKKVAITLFAMCCIGLMAGCEKESSETESTTLIPQGTAIPTFQQLNNFIGYIGHATLENKFKDAGYFAQYNEDAENNRYSLGAMLQSGQQVVIYQMDFTNDKCVKVVYQWVSAESSSIKEQYTHSFDDELSFSADKQLQGYAGGWYLHNESSPSSTFSVKQEFRNAFRQLDFNTISEMASWSTYSDIKTNCGTQGNGLLLSVVAL